MPLPLGTTFVRPFSGYRYPKKKRYWSFVSTRIITTYTVSMADSITLSQSLATQAIYNRALTSSITLSQSLAAQAIYNRIISHTISLSQSLTTNGIYFRALSNSVTIGQSVFKGGKITTLSVFHDITIVPVIRLGKKVQFKLTDSVTTSSLMHEVASVTHSVTVSQAITFTRVIKKTVTHSISISEAPFVNSPRVLTVSHNVLVTDVFAPYLSTFHFTVSDSISLSDTVSERNATTHISIIDNVTVSLFLRQIGRVYNFSVSDAVSVHSQVNRYFFASIEHDVAVFPHNVAHREITRTLTTTVSDSTDFARSTTFSIATQLTVTSIFTYSAVFNRDLTTTSTVNQIFNNVLFIPNPGPHGVVSGVNIVYGYLTLLESPLGTVVLPLPELNDSQKHNDEVQLKRTMNGKVRAFVKRSTTEILTYTWLLDYPKALELKFWALNSLSQNITLTNWKGEIWYGRIISDDIGLKAETRYAGAARQKTSVTIQFEGIKING